MSPGRLLGKLRRLIRRDPGSARQIVGSYRRYLRLQAEDYLSHEADVPRWAEGQRRFVRLAFGAAPRHWRILDAGCGDGVALDELRALGFRPAVGIDLAIQKLRRARVRGHTVLVADIHFLARPLEEPFDAILCSHTLEHAYAPCRVLAGFRRLLAPAGELHVVLPFPDPGSRNERAHVAKYELGTHRQDGAAAVVRYFTERGFELLDQRRDSTREPELWLRLRRVGETG